MCYPDARNKRGSYEYNGHRNPYLALNNAKTKFYSYLQKETDSNTLHVNTFCALVEVIENHGGNIGNDDALTNIETDNPFLQRMLILLIATR